MVVVYYIGWLMDGIKFDFSVDWGILFFFILGEWCVILGWE